MAPKDNSFQIILNPLLWLSSCRLMKQRLKIFGLTGLYWISFFVFCRVVFLTFHFKQAAQLTITEIVKVMLLGLRMDLAMVGYWLILPGLLLTASIFGAIKWIQKANLIITLGLLIFSTLILVLDLELYKHWGFRIDTTPLFYAGTEGAASVNPASLILLLIIFISSLTLFAWTYWKKISPLFNSLQPIPVQWALIMFMLTTALIVPIRSGFGVAPLNTGMVYFHKTKAFPNHAGINAVWNFMKSVVSHNSFRYPKNFFDTQRAEANLNLLTGDRGATKFLITPKKPNIIVIILESFTAKIIKPLGGLDSITPNFNRLANDGILFDNFYASGDRTDKGIVAILSAYPAQPVTSILKYPSKTQSLPYLPAAMSSVGYHTSFVYGGNIGFANMRSYLTSSGFTHITQDDDFAESLDNSKWGVHDEFVFRRLLNECDTATAPFFKVMLSLSSHEPFDVPMKPVIKKEGEAGLFLNSCVYTDRSLGEFIDQAMKKEWWKDTWVIITADHGHRFPDPTELKNKGRFKIPMLWLGGALAKRDTVISTFAGQTDIANTIMGQLHFTNPNFRFSKNIMSAHASSYAIYIFNNGYGYVDPESENIYDFDLHNYLLQSGKPESNDLAKSYMQVLFNDYNKR